MTHWSERKDGRLEVFAATGRPEPGAEVKPPQPAAFVIHGLSHLLAALQAGAETGRPIVAVSAPGASAYAGVAWFAAMIAKGRAAFPGVAMGAILDCGDRAGDGVAALAAGLRGIVFTGQSVARDRLATIAREAEAEIFDRPPPACDLLAAADPAFAARAWCNSLQCTMALRY